MAQLRLEQRENIKFCFNSGVSCHKTILRIRQVYQQSAMSAVSIRKWWNQFQAGRTQVHDLPRSGRLLRATANKRAEVRGLVDQNRCQTVRQLAARSMLGLGTTHRILKSLNFTKRAAAWILQRFNDHNKATRVEICRENLRHFRQDNTLLDRVITGDESWIFAYDPQNKQQAKEWKLPGEVRGTQVRREASVMKTMLVIFMDSKGVVYREFVPRGQGITKEIYLGILKRLCEAVHCRRPQLWFQTAGHNLRGGRARRRRPNFVLHHDNAPAHRGDIVVNWLNQTHTSRLLHPPYSPDIAPCDFWLFERIKRTIKGQVFNSLREVQDQVDQVIGQIPAEEFAFAMRRMRERMRRVLAANGEYFEYR